MKMKATQEMKMTRTGFRRHAARLALAAVLTAGFAASASAGPRGQRPPIDGQRRLGDGQQRPGMDPERRAKILDRIETVRIAKMTDALNLDSATAEKLFPALKPFSDRRATALKEKMQTMQALKRQLDSPAPDAAAVSALLDTMVANQKAFGEIGQEEYVALKKVLDPVTLAKYYKFEIEFERQVGQLIRQARGGGGGGGGGQGGGPGGQGGQGGGPGGPGGAGDNDEGL
jgi:Spy/CpxP family protein refolding chaperone